MVTDKIHLDFVEVENEKDLSGGLNPDDIQ